jgi:hypothetical protein
MICPLFGKARRPTVGGWMRTAKSDGTGFEIKVVVPIKGVAGCGLSVMHSSATP